jgi:hypothetical protein
MNSPNKVLPETQTTVPPPSSTNPARLSKTVGSFIHHHRVEYDDTVDKESWIEAIALDTKEMEAAISSYDLPQIYSSEEERFLAKGLSLTTNFDSTTHSS